jgi:trehalose utilization protein
MRVLVWGENVHETRDERVRRIYPDGMHEHIAAALRGLVPAADVRTATLQQPEHGLAAEALGGADVLVWWSHIAADDVADEVAERVRREVLGGMGLVVLHSAHLSKPFRLLMGTSCNLRWREDEDRELIWTVDPGHPIARGVPSPISLDRHEMYGEVFDIPAPDELVFISNFSGGEVFRSGCCFRRGAGRIFYFSPGHETVGVYHHPSIQRVLANAVSWAAAPRVELVELRESTWSPSGWYEGART